MRYLRQSRLHPLPHCMPVSVAEHPIDLRDRTYALFQRRPVAGHAFDCVLAHSGLRTHP